MLQPGKSFLSKIKEIFIPQSFTPQPVNQEVELKSEVGMDYRKLQNYLKAEKWKEADEEALRVMLAVAKRENEGWLDVEDIYNFPCADLRTIDQLWVKYSNGKFGFSVQKRIYKGLGGTTEYNEEIWEKFGEEVGWKNKQNAGMDYNDMNFDEKRPKVNFTNYTILEKTDINKNWLYYKDITFDKKAPEAHLPITVSKYSLAWNARMGMWEQDGRGSQLDSYFNLFSSLASRLVNCNI
ncbi:GUN4 domain-containing protein [Trichormus sp. NMC-1]|uniref:GUN4 domain-containing protein n=1 Tax=Trichormus sp. NMC-1 TaxID=1853259 RepID=UPI000A509DC1